MYFNLWISTRVSPQVPCQPPTHCKAPAIPDMLVHWECMWQLFSGLPDGNTHFMAIPNGWRHHWFCWEHHRKSPFLMGKPSINGPFNRLSPTFCWCEFHWNMGLKPVDIPNSQPIQWKMEIIGTIWGWPIIGHFFLGRTPKKHHPVISGNHPTKTNYELSLIWSRNLIPSGYLT